ncbi:MAG: Hint domain-containing protein [Rhodobacteraceae bacterium]|nr:Hint domain-containing protein [Paracoccaceae bacterium]
MIDNNDAILHGEAPQDDIVKAGAGNDTVRAGEGNDKVYGEAGNDLLDGGAGDDYLSGGDGDDTFVGGAGNDTFQGNAGLDIIDYSASGAGVTVDLSTGYLAGGDAQGDVIEGGIDGVIGSGFADVLTGFDHQGTHPADTYTNHLFGLGGNDTLNGKGADDLIDGGAGDDDIVLENGFGNDTIIGGETEEVRGDVLDASAVTDDLTLILTAPETGTISDGTDTANFIEIEEFALGSGNDTVIGSGGGDKVDGGAGNDVLTGGGGADTLSGGDDRDTFIVGSSADGAGDFIDGGEGGDDYDVLDLTGAGPLNILYDPLNPENGTVQFLDGDGNVTGTLSFVNIEQVITDQGDGIVEGTAGDDLIDLAYTGDPEGDMIDNNDALLPGEAPQDDIVLAGDGNDTVYAGEGNDKVYGENGDDELHGEAGDDLLVGGAGNDTMQGGDGDDTLLGGDGNDTIIGGEGADTMAGGADRDTFIVNTATAGLGDVIDGNEEGDDFDTLNLTGAGPLRVIYDPLNAENGTVEFLDGVGGPVKGTLSFSNIENVIPCFTPGTLVATPRGELPVEDLRAGDRVITRDNGIQEIRWVGKRALSRADLTAAPHLRPVLVRAGSLGNGLPERDMLVSPNHRMLVTNDRTALYFEEHEVLVAAKHLIDNKGILSVEVLGTTYLHFMFDRHEVVLANGAWTESFQPGDQTLGGMGNAQRSEIFELFPDLKTREGVESYTSARRTLKRHEAALLGR